MESPELIFVSRRILAITILIVSIIVKLTLLSTINDAGEIFAN